ILIGLLAGATYGVKYTAFLTLPFAIGWVWFSRRRFPGWHKLLCLVVPACVMVAPWIVRNWFWVGNPFAPFFNSWFPNPYYHAGMVVRVGKPGIEKWGEWVAHPKPVAHDPWRHHDTCWYDQAKEFVPTGEAPAGKPDPSDRKGERQEGGVFYTVSCSCQ